MLVKMGAVNQNTVLAATVHDCQVHTHSCSHYLNFFFSGVNSCITFIGTYQFQWTYNEIYQALWLSGNAPDLYTRIAWFKIWPGH